MSFPYPPTRTNVANADGSTQRDWLKWFDKITTTLDPNPEPLPVAINQQAGSVIINWSQSTVQQVTLNASVDLAFLEPQFGPLILIVTQASGGTWSIVWPANAYNAPQPGGTDATSTVYEWVWTGTRFLLCGTPVTNQ